MQLALATLEAELDVALGLGAAALELAEAGRVALLSACFEAEALVLGRLQRQDTLRGRSPARFDGTVVRRLTTGTEAQLSGRVLYHALALPRLDALYPDASARTLLNRNLRALLRGYAAAGVPLRYFGTEVLALLGHPVALVGYDVAASGAVLLEVLIGLDNPCVVRPALQREAPESLRRLLRSRQDPRELLARVVSGVVERLSATDEDVSAALSLQALPELDLPTAGRVSSVSIPLGVVEAARSGGVHLSGDLLVSTAALREVERAADELGANEAALAALHGAALDGARPADVLAALQLAFA